MASIKLDSYISIQDADWYSMQLDQLELDKFVPLQAGELHTIDTSELPSLTLQDGEDIRGICIPCRHWLVFVTGISVAETRKVVGKNGMGSFRCSYVFDCNRMYTVWMTLSSNERFQCIYQKSYDEFLTTRKDCFVCERLFPSGHYNAAHTVPRRNAETQRDLVHVYSASFTSGLLELQGIRKGALGIRVSSTVRLKVSFAGSTSVHQVADRLKTAMFEMQLDIPIATWFGVLCRNSESTEISRRSFRLRSEKSRSQNPRMEIVESTEESVWNEIRLKLVKRWISKCRHEHEVCRKNWIRVDAPESYPSRLLFLGSNNDSIRLVYPQNTSLKFDRPYATLSHCWGTKKFERLVSECLDKWLDHIPFARLPKTFRHAISTARILGFEYLWIDSLCIIQSSGSSNSDDWKQEAPRMLEVYGNSALNLAAAGSCSSTDGLWLPFDDLHCSPICLTTSNGIILAEEDNYAKRQVADLHRNPLYSRAWVVQERFLSPFQLSFARSQMVFCCYSSIHFESMPDRNIIGEVGLELNRIPAASVSEADEQWKSIVAQYSLTTQTNLFDRLVALTGLVQRFEHDYKRLEICTRQCAGLWTHNLVETLTWTSSEPDSNLLQEPVGPSWSWINATDGHVIFKPAKRFVGLELYQLPSLTPIDANNSYGPMKGSIRFKTRIFVARLRTKKQFSSNRRSEGDVCHLSRHWNVTQISDLNRHDLGLTSVPELALDAPIPCCDREVVLVTTGSLASDVSCIVGVLCEQMACKEIKQEQSPGYLELHRIGIWQMTLNNSDHQKIRYFDEQDKTSLFHEVVLT